MKKIIFFVLTFSLIVLFAPKAGYAASASLYLSPSTGTNVVGSGFSVAVMVNTGDSEINAANGSLSFDNGKLEVTGVSKGSSIFGLWTQEPTFSNANGSVSFGGGSPTPYKGSAGRICTISFKTKAAGKAYLNFVSGSVLANDGKGTNILSSMGNGSYTVSPESTAPEEGDAPAEDTPRSEPQQQEVVEDKDKPKVISSTHPDQEKWYASNDIKFSWAEDKEISGVSIAFNQKKVDDPGPLSDGEFKSKEYKDVEDGVWYLHLKTRDSSGWSGITHYKVQIDSVPPDKCDMQVKREDEDDWPILFFTASDEMSGLSHYEIYVNSLKEEAIKVDADKDSVKLKDIDIGDHSIAVKPVDKAGNSKFEKVNFHISPIATPVIDEFSREIETSDEFFVKGNAVPNGEVKVFIQKEGEEEIIINSVNSDQQGNWFMTLNEELDNGRYSMWAEAKNSNGIRSDLTAKVGFLVTPPIFVQIGSFVVNYFTVLVSLIFMIVLIVIMLTLFVEIIRKKLRKETGDISKVLDKHLNMLRKEIDKDVNEIVKMKKTDQQKQKKEIKKKMQDKVDLTGKSIRKEVGDVEKILR